MISAWINRDRALLADEGIEPDALAATTAAHAEAARERAYMLFDNVLATLNR